MPKYHLVLFIFAHSIWYSWITYPPQTHSETHNGPVYIQTLFYLYLHTGRSGGTQMSNKCAYMPPLYINLPTMHYCPVPDSGEYACQGWHPCTIHAHMHIMDWFIYKHAHIHAPCPDALQTHSAKRQKVHICTISHRCGTLNMHTNMPKSTFDMVPPVEICTKCTIWH